MAWRAQVSAADDTILVLAGMGVAPWSARGLDEQLEPIEAAGRLRRTINANLRSVGNSAFRKYRVSIRATDLDEPAVGGIWIGKELTVSCVSRLKYPVGGTAERTAVAGSTITDVENGFVSYRPVLTMLVAGWSMTTNEYEATKAWQLDLEEV
jgi:hypothetical protein